MPDDGLPTTITLHWDQTFKFHSPAQNYRTEKIRPISDSQSDGLSNPSERNGPKWTKTLKLYNSASNYGTEKICTKSDTQSDGLSDFKILTTSNFCDTASDHL